jgi:hypothetical protein
VSYPQPQQSLVGLGPFVPTEGELNKRLYEIARVLMWENHYDFVLWDKRGSTRSHGYLMVDEARTIGGFAVRPWNYEGERKADFLLSWIFVASPYRREIDKEMTTAVAADEARATLQSEVTSPWRERFKVLNPKRRFPSARDV